jgi:hypothetical protein
MYTLKQIVSMLKSSSSDLRQNIVRSLGSSSTPLFAVFGHGKQSRLQLAGSGSFVIAGGSHYILTAAHVWEKVLKFAVKVGIVLPDNITHSFLIDVAAVVPIALKPKTSIWNEWGPDLVLLRIPPERVGSIEAFHVFEHLESPPKPLNVKSCECWVVVGSPGELGKFTTNYAEVQITGRFVDPKPRQRGKYDYFDFNLDSISPGMPKSWGGLSGGGLWRVLVYCSPQTGKIDWAQRLVGVPFWESQLKRRYRVIRAHGPNSIKALVARGRRVARSRPGLV